MDLDLFWSDVGLVGFEPADGPDGDVGLDGCEDPEDPDDEALWPFCLWNREVGRQLCFLCEYTRGRMSLMRLPCSSVLSIT